MRHSNKTDTGNIHSLLFLILSFMLVWEHYSFTSLTPLNIFLLGHSLIITRFGQWNYLMNQSNFYCVWKGVIIAKCTLTLNQRIQDFILGLGTHFSLISVGDSKGEAPSVATDGLGKPLNSPSGRQRFLNFGASHSCANELDLAVQTKNQLVDNTIIVWRSPGRKYSVLMEEKQMSLCTSNKPCDSNLEFGRVRSKWCWPEMQERQFPKLFFCQWIDSGIKTKTSQLRMHHA